LLAKIQRTIERFGMAQPGESWGVAVSGGPDSIALLSALAELSDELGLSLGVVHFNHQLRSVESDEDEAFVRRRAQALGLAFECDRATVAAGENLESAARSARYAFFEHLLSQGKFDRIATGHTRSDQAETVLFRVLRGTGLAGLAAVRPVREPGIVRPLIDVTRAEVMQWLATKDGEWREDSSNQDTRFSRNRIRHELMPQLAAEWNPQVEQALARLADQAAAEEAYWSRIVDQAIGSIVLRRSDDGIEIDCKQARELDSAVLGRCLDRLAREVKAPGRQIDAEAIEGLKAMTIQAGPKETHLPGLEAQRSCDVLRLSAPESSTPHYEPTAVSLDMDLVAPDGRSRLALRLKLAANRRASVGGETAIDWAKLRQPLYLRAWSPGDRVGDAEARPLREMFRRCGVPAWERVYWPVLVMAGDKVGSEVVVWSRGFGTPECFAATPTSAQVLEITELTSDGTAICQIEDWTSPRSRDSTGLPG
jgi:tRNA(Ile)-lysidine synthase